MICVAATKLHARSARLVVDKMKTEETHLRRKMATAHSEDKEDVEKKLRAFLDDSDNRAKEVEDLLDRLASRRKIEFPPLN